MNGVYFIPAGVKFFVICRMLNGVERFHHAIMRVPQIHFAHFVNAYGVWLFLFHANKHKILYAQPLKI